MKKSFSVWQWAGFAFTSLFGTFLHFLYDWTGESTAAAVISGVNESTWEHMKILFFPLFAFALIERIFYRECKKFWCIKLCGTVTGLLLIPLIFYTYNGAIGKSPDWLNIAIFFLCAAAVFLLETGLYNYSNYRCNFGRLAFFLLCVIGILFVIFTFKTPRIPLFQDPLTGSYGIG